MEKQNKKIVLIIVLIVLIIAGGFISPSEMHYVTRIETEHVIYKQAYYSNSECGFDWEGDYSCWTNSWSEIVSDKWVLQTSKDYAGFTYRDYCPYKKGIFCDGEPLEWEYSKVDFDRVLLHSKLTIQIWYDIGEGYEDFIKVKKDVYESTHIGDSLTVSKWYLFRL